MKVIQENISHFARESSAVSSAAVRSTSTSQHVRPAASLPVKFMFIKETLCTYVCVCESVIDL